MTPTGKILTSAFVTGLIALAVYYCQAVRLDELRAGSAAGPVMRSGTAAALSGKSAVPPPRSPRPEPSGRLLDRLDVKLRSLLSAEQLSAMSEATDEAAVGRMRLIAGLTDEEAGRVRRHYAAARLEKAKLQKSSDAAPSAAGEVDRVRDARVLEELGPERSERWQAAEAARRKADAEQAAAAAVARVALTANLSPAQKDALYAAFLAKSSAPPPETDSTPRLSISTSIQGDDDLPPPDLTAEAKSILTPEQFAVYEQHKAAAGMAPKQMMAQLQSMIPAMIAALQELLSDPPGPSGR